MKIKKLFALFAAAMLVFCASCSDPSPDTSSVPSGSTAENVPGKYYSLMFCENDSINPYKAVSKHNKLLTTLMYDPLVKLDNSFRPVFVIAESAECSGKTCTVTLKNIVFSDGSPLTARDVVYSEALAKNSNTLYASELAEVSDCTAQDEKTVVFKMKKVDPYFANLLDFPIIKAESDKLTDKNKRELPPIGSGRYIFDTMTESLKINESYFGNISPIKSLELINSPDDESSTYNIGSGNVSIVPTDLSDGEVPSITGTAVKTNLNNIVFLGTNNYYGKMSNVKLRYAVSAALNRNEICSDAFFSYAVPANGIFHPLWSGTEGMQNISSSTDLQNYVAYLKDLGYNDKDTNGHYVNAGGKVLSLTLVFNEENGSHVSAAKAVKSQLESAGISVTSKALSRAKYMEAVTYGNYDIYIGEVKLFNNMDVSELITQSGALAYGLSSPAKRKAAEGQQKNDTLDKSEETDTEDESQEPGITIDDAVNGFYAGKLSLTDIVNAFNAEMPIIPLCYRCGVTICDARLGAIEISSVNDPFFGIENIK